MDTHVPNFDARPASLLASDQRRPLLRSRTDLAALVRTAVEPAAAALVLLASAWSVTGSFGGRYLVLTLFVILMTFRVARAQEASGYSARSILRNWVLVCLFLLALGRISGTLEAFEQLVLVIWMLATPLVAIGTHRVLPRILPRILAAEDRKKTVVIAGANALGLRLVERIRGEAMHELRVAGYFDDRGQGRVEGIRGSEVLGPLHRLAEYVKANGIDVIYIAMPMAEQPRIVRLLEDLHDTTASVYFVPDIYFIDLIQARVDSVAGMPVLAVCESPFHGFNALLKRASDVVLSALILVLISPLMLAIAIGVKLESPGPVLFRQRRYGLDGREIVVYKFRSMTCCEDGAEIRQATREDARVTRLGAILRAYSLDELPQFINVLQGRMSIVGPRPHAVAHNELYRKLIRSYMIRHKVRPGITGLAQVHGLRGETKTVEQMQARVEKDLAYLRDWSPWLDVEIMLKTVIVVLAKRNAY